MLGTTTYKKKDRKAIFFHPAGVLLLGLMIAQAIATFQVYLSNRGLYAAMTAIKEAGYLPVPNQLVIPGLLDFAPAFYGGIFFTLSIGAGISLLSMTSAWIWTQFLRRNKHVLILLLLFWMGLPLWVNARGFSLFATLYFLFIPPSVFGLAVKWFPQGESRPNNRQLAIHLVPVIILAILWFTQYDRYLFTDLRDYLLFSNAAGKKVNSFYYDYTLYAAEAFKSLNQKMLKTCSLEDFPKGTLLESIKRVLIRQDYLPLEANGKVDLKIIQKEGRLVFEHHGRKILETGAEEFRDYSGDILSQFAAKCDRFAVFRRLTFISLLIGYPLTLYIFFQALAWLITCCFLEPQKAARAASAVCFIISLGILAQFYFAREANAPETDLSAALKSDYWPKQVAALKIIQEKGMEISSFQVYPQLIENPNIPVRYWLAKALAHSRKPETYKAVLILLNDANPNVVSMAYYALAQRGDPKAVNDIIERIMISDNWYSQLYAYKALRALGWNQTKFH
jgi:hypothetical protein